MKKNIRGFTIVELLIVIVVIAILAAISIVAYNGIQTRAKMSQTTQVALSYKKAFKLLQTDTGALPTMNACLGPASYYPTGCTNGGQTAVKESSVDAMLATYGMVSQPVTPYTANDTPIMYAYNFWGYDSIMWLVPNDQTCRLPVISNNGTNWGLHGGDYTYNHWIYRGCISPIAS